MNRTMHPREYILETLQVLGQFRGISQGQQSRGLKVVENPEGVTYATVLITWLNNAWPIKQRAKEMLNN